MTFLRNAWTVAAWATELEPGRLLAAVRARRLLQPAIEKERG